MRPGDPAGMSESQHPAIAARRQRFHRIRVRVATVSVALFVALFSVIYPQSQTSANVTTAHPQVSGDGTAGSAANQPTPMTSAQS